MTESIVSIYDKERFVGTGFSIGNDSGGTFFITCGHVVKDIAPVVLGRSAEVVQNKYDDGLDLALLYVHDVDREPLSIGTSFDKKRADVLGYSRFFEGKVKYEPIRGVELKSDLIVESKGEENFKYLKIYTDEPICKGYSGSPVICKDSGNVVGVVVYQGG